MSAGLPTGMEIAERYRRRRDAADALYEALGDAHTLLVARGLGDSGVAKSAWAALRKARGEQ